MSWVMCFWLLYTCEIVHGYYHRYLYPQQDDAVSAGFYTDADALDRFQNVKKRAYRRRYRMRRTCRQWNSHCFPWAKRKDYACCYNHGLSCQCNLWMQNCRCVSKLWGR